MLKKFGFSIPEKCQGLPVSLSFCHRKFRAMIDLWYIW